MCPCLEKYRQHRIPPRPCRDGRVPPAENKPGGEPDPSQGGFLEPDELQHLELPVPPFLPLCFTDCGHPVPVPEPGWHLEPSDPCHELGQCREDTEQRPAGFGRALGASAEGPLADLKGGLILPGAAEVGSATKAPRTSLPWEEEAPLPGTCKIFPAGKRQLLKEEVFETVLCCK